MDEQTNGHSHGGRRENNPVPQGVKKLSFVFFLLSGSLIYF